MCRTLVRRYETRRLSRVCEEQLGRKESVQCHSCSLYERDDQEGAQGARYQCLVKDDLNEEEATAIGDEAAEVPVEDDCQVRDSNTCKLITSIDLDDL